MVRSPLTEQRLAGLADQPRPGAAPRYHARTDRRILAALDAPAPSGMVRWTAKLLAAHPGNVWDQHIRRLLRAQRIDLAARRSWCTSDDPDFVAKAADVLGLDLAPPHNTVVLAADETPHILALERAQGWLRLPNGRTLTGRSHDRKRHGTTTLSAAVNVAPGEVKAGHYRRRRVEFLDFMDRIVATYPGREIHVVLDNRSTHKPKRDAWLARHMNVCLHFTPTHASRRNQVEIRFSILQHRTLAGTRFTSPSQVRERIDALVAAYNQSARPFAWTRYPAHPDLPRTPFRGLVSPRTTRPVRAPAPSPSGGDGERLMRGRG